MARRMKRKLHSSERKKLAVIKIRDSNGLSQAAPEQISSHLGAVVPLAPAPRMIAVRMGDHGVFNRTAGVDVKISGSAIKPLRSERQHERTEL